MRSPSHSKRAPLAGALLVSFTALAAGLTAPATASAQGAPAPGGGVPQPSGAQALRDKARASLAAGDTASACLLFEQSYQLAKASGPADDVLFDVADCHDKLGNKAQAATEFDQVAASGGARAEEAKRRAVALRAPAPAPAPGPPPFAAGAPPPPPFPGAPLSDATPMPPPPILPVSVETLTGGPPPTALGNFMDTRLSWTFGTDDVIHPSGTFYPLSQGFNVGDRPQYRLFFDNLNSRFSGRENVTHLALYKKLPAFINKLDTEASMVLRFDFDALATNSNNVNKAIYDAGSFIRLFYHTNGDSEGKVGLGLTLWPLDTDRFRLGYLYDLSWGGTNANINQSIFPGIVGTAPGAKLQYDGDGWSIFAGFKTASIQQIQEVLAPGTSQLTQINAQQTNVGVLGGGTFDFTDNLHLDVGGGYFQQGTFTLPDVVGKPVYTAGFSGRFVVHAKDMLVPQSIDFLLYRNDPNKPQVIFKPEVYVEGKTTWMASIEYDNLFQNLKDFYAVGVTQIQQARAAALQGNVKSGFFRGSLTGIYRDLAYILRNQPSLIPDQTIPTAGATTKPEIFVAAAADYYFDGPRLTPGISAGVQFPATFTSHSVGTMGAAIDRTISVSGQTGQYNTFPANQSAVPVFVARLSLKWEVSRILSALVWAQYKRDNNLTFLLTDPSTGAASVRQFVNPDFVGFGTSAQARF